MRLARRLALTCALVPVLALAGCADDAGSNDDHAPHDAATAGEESTAAGAADIMFAQMMIPHHEQAIVMSDIVLENPDTGPEVQTLAEQIKEAQGPEIELLLGWLSDWGAEPLADDSAHHAHMDGMLTPEELDELRAATGAAVDRVFLEQMIAHHEGAVSMAQDQLAGGENESALALAQEIIDTQQAEIEQMRALLSAMR